MDSILNIHISKVSVSEGVFVINPDGEALRLCFNDEDKVYFLTSTNGKPVTEHVYGSVQAVFDRLHPDAKMYQMRGAETPRLIGDKIFVTLENIKSVFAKSIKVPMEKIVIMSQIIK